MDPCDHSNQFRPIRSKLVGYGPCVTSQVGYGPCVTSLVGYGPCVTSLARSAETQALVGLQRAGYKGNTNEGITNYIG